MNQSYWCSTSLGPKRKRLESFKKYGEWFLRRDVTPITNVRIIKKRSEETPMLVEYNGIHGDNWIKYLAELFTRQTNGDEGVTPHIVLGDKNWY